MNLKKLLSSFFALLLSCAICYTYADEKDINMQYKGHHGTHIEHYIPFDQPDVYYDSDDQTITIDGDGAVTYYDVEIAPVTSSVPVITTQVSGYYDTIDVSSLPAAEYVITIYSPEDNTYEGFFEIL